MVVGKSNRATSPPRASFKNKPYVILSPEREIENYFCHILSRILKRLNFQKFPLSLEIVLTTKWLPGSIHGVKISIRDFMKLDESTSPEYEVPDLMHGPRLRIDSIDSPGKMDSQDVISMLLSRRPESVSVEAPAKLNLFLELLEKRPDSFHELETVMTTVSLYDTLVFEKSASPEVTLEIVPSDASDIVTRQLVDFPLDERNLILKAANLLSQQYIPQCGVAIKLIKRIPMEAGLAGGSSDAAATLSALNLLWNLNLTRRELQEFAVELGSDVPFFLCEQPVAVCRGRGEKITPIAFPVDLHFVIAFPGSGLSTADVYQYCRISESPRSCDHLVRCLRRGNPADVGSELFNALQSSAETLNEDVVELRRTFDRLPVAGHSMTGSGTAWFGICSTGRQARSIASRMKQEFSCFTTYAKVSP